VHATDLADLYLLVLERGEHGEYYIGANDSGTVRAFTEAAARSRNLPGVAAEELEDTRARLGADFADALLLDQQVDPAKARALGWTPSGPSLIEELETGSYAAAAE